MSSTTQLCLAVSLGLLMSSGGSHVIGQPLIQPVPMVAPAGPIGIELPMTASLVRSTPFAVGQTTRPLVIPIDYTRQAHVAVVIPSQGGAVTLTRPDNQVVTATNAASLGAEWTQIDGTAPLAALFSPDPQWTLVSITLPSTAPAGWPAGEHSLSITVPQPLTAIRHSVATVEFRTAILAGFAMLDSAVTTGQPVGVGILVRDPRGGVPSLAVTAASVEVTAVGPAGTTPVTVQATDDGLNGDVAANDGLYTVAFSPPAAGRWSLVATVTGMTPVSAAQPVSVPFARTVFGEIDAAPAAARFAVAPAAGAAFTDSAVDDQGDSLFDRIVIGRGVVVDAAGAGQKYRMELTLRTALGVELTARGTPTQLAAGTHTLTADLLGTDVWAVQESGPFQVVSARLYGTYALPAPPGPPGGPAPSTGGGEVLLDTLVPTAPATTLHATAAYNLSDAQRRPIRLGPVGNPITADTTVPPNGKFDTLTIPMGLKVPRAGLYRYRAALRDVTRPSTSLAGPIGCNRAFVWTEGTIEVTAAQVETQLNIDLVFDGATIGRYGSPTPWALGEVVVWSELTSTRWSTAAAIGEVPPLYVADFEQYTGFPDCNTNGIHDICDIRDGRLVDANRNGIPDICEPPCSPADIALSDGAPGRDDCLDNGDFQLFFENFFGAVCTTTCGYTPIAACNPADIADAAGVPGADGCVDNGDFSLFFAEFFENTCPCGAGAMMAGGEGMRAMSAMARSAASAGLPPEVIQERLNALRNLGRPITPQDVQDAFPELLPGGGSGQGGGSGSGSDDR